METGVGKLFFPNLLDYTFKVFQCAKGISQSHQHKALLVSAGKYLDKSCLLMSSGRFVIDSTASAFSLFRQQKIDDVLKTDAFMVGYIGFIH